MIINVLKYLDDSTLSVPQKLAFVDEHHSISYSDLQRRANKLVPICIKKQKETSENPL